MSASSTGPADLGEMSSTPITNVLVLCGIPMRNASPDEDGWFLSDFLLLNHIFANAPKSRDRWHTSADPAALLSQHNVSEYLHGNPWQERKVVLRHDFANFANVVVSGDRDLKATFLEDVRQTATQASQNKEPLVLVLLGHGTGEFDGHRLEVGLDEYIYPQEILNRIQILRNQNRIMQIFSLSPDKIFPLSP